PDPPPFNDHANRQIEALLKEKATRSKGRKKMDSQLIYGVKNKKKEKIADDVDFDEFQINLPLDENGDVTIDITASVSNQLLAKLRAMGVTIHNAHPQHNSIRATADLTV